MPDSLGVIIAAFIVFDLIVAFVFYVTYIRDARKKQLDAINAKNKESLNDEEEFEEMMKKIIEEDKRLKEEQENAKATKASTKKKSETTKKSTTKKTTTKKTSATKTAAAKKESINGKKCNALMEGIAES